MAYRIDWRRAGSDLTVLTESASEAVDLINLEEEKGARGVRITDLLGVECALADLEAAAEAENRNRWRANGGETAVGRPRRDARETRRKIVIEPPGPPS